MKPRLTAICLAILYSVVAAAGPEPAPEVTAADGRSFSGRLVSLSKAEAVFQTDTGRRTMPLAELWSIRLGDSEKLMWQPGQKVVVLAGEREQWLSAGRLAVKDDKITVENKLLGQVELEMSAVRAMYLPRPGQSPDYCRKRHLEMKLPAAGTDYLVAEDAKGNWVPVAGVLKSISAEKVLFEFEGVDRTVDINLVRVIELARIAKAPSGLAGYLVGRDGTTVGFASLSLAGSSLSTQAGAVSAKAVQLSALAEIRFTSDRCVHLSDLAPAKVVQDGLFDVAFGYRSDRSTAGGPIRLGGTTYSKGLGLHSRCEISYDLQAQYAGFAAVAGIDDAIGWGNAQLKILGDGKELIKPLKLVAKAKPVPISCDVTGVKVLSLVVDFGDDGVDVGDHVSLAEARLIKPQATTARGE